MRTNGTTVIVGALVAAGLVGGCLSDLEPRGFRDGTRVYSTPAGLNAQRVQWPQRAETLDGEFERGAWRVGDVYITGQPTEAALRRMIEERGVTLVVSVRTPSEMETVKKGREATETQPARAGFDEFALMREYSVSHGVEFLHLPMGGEEHPPTPDQVDAFAEALARHSDAALAHCSVGGRVSQLWAAYLVRHRGVELNEARRQAGMMNFGPSTLERLLGVTVHWQVYRTKRAW